MVFIVNHPWISYGLFYAQALSSIPGGYYDQYDLIELNAAVRENSDEKTMASARARWTKALTRGKKYFLTAASDTHDVLKTGGNANLLDDFATQLGLGHSYASYGPLMFLVGEQIVW